MLFCERPDIFVFQTNRVIIKAFIPIQYIHVIYFIIAQVR